MATFLAIYRGRTVGEAELVAASADPHLVAYAAGRMLRESNADGGDAPPDGLSTGSGARCTDPVLEAMQDGQRNALELISREVSQHP